ncbi:MAG: ornithine-acyl-ACP acyltransferase [Rhodobacteraceae bacterium]|nr:ornithine-acyl-ACP acyltransferase [Paracoccaceae bacterium]MBR26256.1 ornithine-acyl-ACP acyltransferase [Paracoccaceae bacterium]
MRAITRGRHTVRFTRDPEDVIAAQRLRFKAFIAARPGAAVTLDRAEGLDRDAYDDLCWHALVEDTESGELLCCFRMMRLSGGSEIGRSYSAQYYELSALADYPAPMVEMGRFCMAPGVRDPEVIRAAWGAMTAFVEAEGVGLLFGCSSFEGVDAEAYMDAFAYLKDKHLAPKRWLPRAKAPRVFAFAKALRLRRPDMKLAMRRMPPLLRSYLLLGGWVSDHAVIDSDLNTLHVFTGVEINRVPQARRRLMDRLTGGGRTGPAGVPG